MCRVVDLCVVQVSNVSILLVKQTVAMSALAFTISTESLTGKNLYLHWAFFRVCNLVFLMHSVDVMCVVLVFIVRIFMLTQTTAISAVALKIGTQSLTCINSYRFVIGTSIVKNLRVSQCTTVYSFELCVTLPNMGIVPALLSWFQTVLIVFVFCVTNALYILHYPFIVNRNVLCGKAHSLTYLYSKFQLLSLGKYMKYFYILQGAIIPKYTCIYVTAFARVQKRASQWGMRDKRFIVFVVSLTLIKEINLLIKRLNWIYLIFLELALFNKQLIFNDFLF